MAEVVVVDTNVGIVANLESGASPACELACVRALRAITKSGHLVLDDRDLILREYRRYLSMAGQPGVGDEFVRWAHDNHFNPERCTRVQVTPSDQGEFEEFPEDASLAGFHDDDQKFVAVAASHEERPPILAALDRGWANFQEALKAAGVDVRLLCPDDIKRT